MYGYIYKTTNLINGKIYVGQHKSETFDLNYYGSGKYLYNALHKYGKENFSVEILEWCETKEIINEREIYYIQKLNSRNRNIGYNIAYGGEGGDLVSCLPEEDRKRLSEMLSEMTSEFNRRGITGNKGKHLSEEHRRKISEGNKGKKRSKEAIEAHRLKVTGLPAWNKGLTASDPRVAKYVHKRGEFKHSEETKQLISERLKGRPKLHFTDLEQRHINMSNSQKARVRSKSEIERVKTLGVGRIWVNDGKTSKMIYPEEFETYSNVGFKKGRIYRRHGKQ